MNFDFLNKEITFSGNKKDTYPTKKTINLYYKEDKTTRPSTVALYVLFFLTVGLLAAKILVFDLAAELERAEAQMESKYAHLEEQYEKLKDYNDISSQYSRYSSSYLRPEEKIVDRMEVLDMLERAVFAYSNTTLVSITDDIISISFNEADLEETASIMKMLEAYPIVEYVTVQTNSLQGEYNSVMTITLVSEVEDTTGGEQ